MTDEELGRDLLRCYCDIRLSSDVHCPPKWVQVAARARELCGMRPEERAVIEAAEAFRDKVGPPGQSDTVYVNSLPRAEDTLRAARQPKPPWSVAACTDHWLLSGPRERIRITRSPDGPTDADLESFARRIAAALNATEHL